jgi:hypothetical protein
MRSYLVSALAAAFVVASTPSFAKNFKFPLVRSSAVATCAPKASAVVTISPTGGGKETLHVEVFGFKPNVELDVFIVQSPKAPLVGMSWYQGDMTTDSNGTAVADFEGRFNKETFVVAPGVVPAPVLHPADAATNPATKPIHMFHIGIWFNKPDDAVAEGCAATVTPFNGDHTAGVQVLNTSNFPDAAGPLRFVP